MSDIEHWIKEHQREITNWPAVPGDGAECLVAACGRTAFARSLCKPHYFRARRASEAEIRKENKSNEH